jgi:hypothetical protein
MIFCACKGNRQNKYDIQASTFIQAFANNPALMQQLKLAMQPESSNAGRLDKRQADKLEEANDRIVQCELSDMIRL